MRSQVIIDGNNLLFAMHEHAPGPHIGRVAMAKFIEEWAERSDRDVTLVFDGPRPDGGLGNQMESDRIDVRFSAPETADDIIVRLIHAAGDPTGLHIVSSDKAILYEARLRRCATSDSPAFVQILFDFEPKAAHPQDPPQPEKPTVVSQEDAAELMDLLDEDNGPDPFDGSDAMQY